MVHFLFLSTLSVQNDRSDTTRQLRSLLVLSLEIKFTEKQEPQYCLGLKVQHLLKLVSGSPDFLSKLTQAFPAVRNLSSIGY